MAEFLIDVGMRVILSEMMLASQPLSTSINHCVDVMSTIDVGKYIRESTSLAYIQRCFHLPGKVMELESSGNLN